MVMVFLKKYNGTMTMIIGVYNIDVDVSIFSEKFMIYLFLACS
jgi:hypothetical protein